MHNAGSSGLRNLDLPPCVRIPHTVCSCSFPGTSHLPILVLVLPAAVGIFPNNHKQGILSNINPFFRLFSARLFPVHFWGSDSTCCNSATTSFGHVRTWPVMWRSNKSRRGLNPTVTISITMALSRHASFKSWIGTSCRCSSFFVSMRSLSSCYVIMRLQLCFDAGRVSEIHEGYS